MSDLLKQDIVETEYDASQIQVLEGLEAVRKRPGMYIGSTSASGLHHLVYEIVDNAVDEALAGSCRHITVTINEGNTITVTDDGRGIPVDIQAQTGKPALEVVYTVLHAGGKFGGGGYKVSGGLHGVGASVVNALSEWLEVSVHCDGRIYQMKFSRGEIQQPMRVIGTTDRHGTFVTFKPDPEMFDTLEYDYETLHTRMREQAFLNAGLHITIADERIDSADKPEKERRDSMCYEGGIREFARWYNRHKTPLHDTVIYMAGKKGDETAEIALQYNDSFNETIVSFANDIHTPEGGMHEEGFKRALTSVLNAYGLKKGIIKPDRCARWCPQSSQTSWRRFWRRTRPWAGRFWKRRCWPAARVRRPRRRARASGARRVWNPARCPISCATATTATRRSPRSTSSRATRPEALPRRDAIRASRRFCPCGARC